MSPDSNHIRAILLAAASAGEGYCAWFLGHIQAINHLMQFGVYAVALTTGVLGLRKVLKRS